VASELPATTPEPPPLAGVLETVLYYTAPLEARVDRFYRNVLGMRPIGRKPGQFLFFRAGRSVFLLFETDRAREQESPPPHGSRGPGHTCFQVPTHSYGAWKAHLTAHEVPVEGETEWPGGGRSFYFRDPAGNALEIADRDIWPD